MNQAERWGQRGDGSFQKSLRVSVMLTRARRKKGTWPPHGFRLD